MGRTIPASGIAALSYKLGISRAHAKNAER
jgi:hypothetical protein